MNATLKTDQELIALLKEGDQSALEQIYERYHIILFSQAYRRLKDREEVRDIVHEIFLSLWKNRERLNITSSLSAYLYVSVRSRVLNVFRNNKVRDQYLRSLQDFMDLRENNVEKRIQEQELSHLIESEISFLPKQMRLIFEMSRFQEKSHKEIAEELNLSPQTVRTQIRNALRILRIKLGTNLFILFF